MSAGETEMQVLKRNNTYEDISFDKILRRIKTLGKEAKLTNVNYSSLCLKVIDQLYDGIPTTKIDELTAEQCASMNTIHPNYGRLAALIIVSNHYKNTPGTLKEVVERLYNEEQQLLSNKFYTNVQENHEIY